MKYQNVESEWVNDFLTFIKVDGIVFVRVDDIQQKLSEIKKTLINEKRKGGENK